MPQAPRPEGPARGLWPLASLNFFMADMQAGVGPFLAVFLVFHGWHSGWIGSVMTIGGIAGVAMTTPIGALVDATTRKRACVVALCVCTIVASFVVLLSQRFWLVAASQVATSIAGAAVVPTLAGITLGMVRQRGFSHQNGRNQVFNHAGNAAGAALFGLAGLHFGLPAVFWLSAGFGVFAIVSVLLIPGDSIDDAAARGLEKGAGQNEKASGFRILVESKPLLVLAAALGCFHLGNGAMLALFGMGVSARGEGNPAATVALTVVVAQAAMIVAALIAMWMGSKRGAWTVLFVSFLALPVRGWVAAHFLTRWGVYPVQILDGVGSGLQSVAIPNLVARVLRGTGRVNVGQGAVMTVQGLGGSLSPVIGGWVAEEAGYSASFLLLGSFALVSIALWIVFRSTIREACEHGEPVTAKSRREAPVLS